MTIYGKVIREAGWKALEQGFCLADALDLAAEFTSAEEDTPPIALMTYYNPMLQMGLETVAERALTAGVGGFIVPDLPVEVAEEWLSVSEGLDTVFLVAPTSTPERMRLVGERSQGFVYCVSSLGVTGVRDELPPGLLDLVNRVREHTDLPIAVGFGVGTPDMAAKVGQIADGVIVGSAVVAKQEDPEAIGDIVKALADGLA